MTKFFKIISCAAMIFAFSSANVSAAVINVSDDDISTFMTKCNQELKKSDSANNLDAPKLQSTFKTYEDILELGDGLKVKFICMTRDDKIYSIKLETDNYSKTAKDFYEGMNIVFLKALGLTDEDARELTEKEDRPEWRKEKFIPTLNKNFIVNFKHSKLMIVATDKKN